MQSIREQRRDQMFPKLDPVEIERGTSVKSIERPNPRGAARA
jgi:hypothetical protein